MTLAQNETDKKMKKKHNFLITIGCFLWIVSFFGETFRGQPYSTIGIIISPILTVIGVIYWFKYYKETRRHYPKFQTVTDSISFIGGKFTLSFEFLLHHILKIWTIGILFWMGIVLIIVLTMRRSDAFEATKNYCQTNQEILSQTGEIKYFGVIVGGNITTTGHEGTAELSFIIVGSKGNFRANSKLSAVSGVWTVENLYL